MKTNENGNLTGKVPFVTGAGRGPGMRIARAALAAVRNAVGQADDLLVAGLERPMEVCMAHSPDTIAHKAPRIPRRGRDTTAALATAAFGALLLTAAVAPTAATSAPSTPTTAACPAPTGSPVAGVTGSPTPVLSTEPNAGETRVRFTVGDAEIIVRLADNPTSRDFLSMLPLTLEFEDFASMEKIGYLPRELTTEGSAGGAPANGDLIYFVPWGNLGFFYDAERRDESYDDRVIPIGTVETGDEPLDELLDELETGPVRVEHIRRGASPAPATPTPPDACLEPGV